MPPFRFEFERIRERKIADSHAAKDAPHLGEHRTAQGRERGTCITSVEDSFSGHSGTLCADCNYRTPADPLCQAAHGYLQSCHCPGVKPTHKGQHAISESKFRLPHWEEDVDQVRVPIVQSVRDTCNHQRTPRLRMSSGRANVQRSCQQARHWRSPPCGAAHATYYGNLRRNGKMER